MSCRLDRLAKQALRETVAMVAVGGVMALFVYCLFNGGTA